MTCALWSWSAPEHGCPWALEETPLFSMFWSTGTNECRMPRDGELPEGTSVCSLRPGRAWPPLGLTFLLPAWNCGQTSRRNKTRGWGREEGLETVIQSNIWGLASVPMGFHENPRIFFISEQLSRPQRPGSSKPLSSQFYCPFPFALPALAPILALFRCHGEAPASEYGAGRRGPGAGAGQASKAHVASRAAVLKHWCVV